MDGTALTRTVRDWQALAAHPIVEFDPAAWRIDRDGPANSLSAHHGLTWPVWFKRTAADD